MIQITEENLKIYVKNYLRTIKILDFATRFLKINIRLHSIGDTIKKGDIFVFNHFSRFETFVPQYLFFKKSKVFCRSIASSEFFSEGVLSHYLLSLGAVPHSYLNLFNFLTREINKDVKLIVFPEGSMIKDKNVIDKGGTFHIYSRDNKVKRRPHTGAAVIALHTETYRFLYRMALEKENKERIEFYAGYFPRDKKKSRKQVYNRPTQVVPASITFYPLRISENFLKTIAEQIGNKSQRLAEEMAIEGNIITKNTDMDIYLGTPINVQSFFTFTDNIILKALYHLKIGPDFEPSHKSTFACKFVSSLFKRRTKLLAGRLTRQYMKEIYSHITINLSHIASRLIFYNIMKKKINSIEKKNFFTQLYCVIKNMQNEKDLILHPQLTDPELYGPLLDGKSEQLNQFLSMARDQELITITEDGFTFLPKLLARQEFDSIRLENTPRVRYNEVEPIKPIKNIVKKVCANFDRYKKSRLPEYLFDDDVKTYHQDKEKFSGPDYEEINKRETKTLSAAPFFLKSHRFRRGKTGVLLVHGFPASPAEMKPLGKFLHNEGFTVYGVRLKGYGTSPHDLDQIPWVKSIESIDQGYKVLSICCEKIVVVGFSMGAVIALDMASKARDNIRGAVSISASIEVEGMDNISLVLSAQMEKLIKLIPGVKSKFIDWETKSPKINYRSVPLQKIVDLKNYIEQVKEQLKSISAPLLIIQATQDPLIKHHSAEYVYKNVSSKNKEIFWFESDRHIIVTKDCVEVYRHVLDFIKKI